jgi:predicted ArsR family transcriptional regulator
MNSGFGMGRGGIELPAVSNGTRQKKKGAKHMENAEEMISKGEALNQIQRALRRTALLYHFFAKTMIDELGDERGTQLIRKAIDAYGTHIGRQAKRRAESRGFSLRPENFESDLPDLAWKTEAVMVDGEERVRVHECPLAREWLEMGDAKRARLYCFVDQAKMQGFNPDYEYIHLKNVLDGDPYCELVIRPTRKNSLVNGKGENDCP